LFCCKLLAPLAVLTYAAGAAGAAGAAPPIVGGQGKFRYQYMPELLAIPAGAAPLNDHGLVTDHNDNIILTYEPDHASNDTRCMIRWAPDGSGVGEQFGPGAALCRGTPHGLRVAHEGPDETPFLYHANNAQALHKTTMDGELVWSVQGPPVNATTGAPFLPFKPTWFATPPGSPYVFMADGYGSSIVHVYTAADGKYTGHTFGSRGSGDGQFETCHSIHYDPRTKQIVVSDRENHRHQWFDFDVDAPDKFTYSHQAATTTSGAGSRPCNMRFKNGVFDGEHYSIVPDLVGPVGILDSNNKLVSNINVSGLIGDLGHLHPHDAMFLPNGDIVVGTWTPGRISYWKKLGAEE
jgi:hypothetical protein